MLLTAEIEMVLPSHPSGSSLMVLSLIQRLRWK
jgi:hypothetical protein